MSKRVTVIVEGREYVVEVDDLTRSPIKATVNNKTYFVELPRQTEEANAYTKVASEAVPPKPVTPPSTSTNERFIKAPMPGTIAEMTVKEGDSIKAGDVVCVLEAMKMKNKIHSSRDGVIASVNAAPGQDVDYGSVLVTFE